MTSTAAPSTAPQTTVGLYERPLIPLGFDVLIATVFGPFGGVGRLRNAALDCLAIRPGTRVLELGCGTGGITRLLVARGAGRSRIGRSARRGES